jgi:hypothetical protein
MKRETTIEVPDDVYKLTAEQRDTLHKAGLTSEQIEALPDIRGLTHEQLDLVDQIGALPHEEGELTPEQIAQIPRCA